MSFRRMILAAAVSLSISQLAHAQTFNQFVAL
jgi:hypothetical protein